MTMPLLAMLYDSLNTGTLSPEDIDPDLAAVQVWVRFVEPCPLHPDGGCDSVAVHEFAVDATSCIYARCDPEGPVPDTTIDIAAVRFLWGSGHVTDIGAEQVACLRPLVTALLSS